MVANNNNSNQLTKFTNKSIIFSPIYWYWSVCSWSSSVFCFFYLNGTVKIKKTKAGGEAPRDGKRRGAGRQQRAMGEQQGVAGIDRRGGSG